MWLIVDERCHQPEKEAVGGANNNGGDMCIYIQYIYIIIHICTSFINLHCSSVYGESLLALISDGIGQLVTNRYNQYPYETCLFWIFCQCME